MLAVKKAFHLLGGDMAEISTKNETLKNKTGTYDEERLEDYKANPLNQFDDDKRTNLIMSGKQVKKITKEECKAP